MSTQQAVVDRSVAEGDPVCVTLLRDGFQYTGEVAPTSEEFVDSSSTDGAVPLMCGSVRVNGESARRYAANGEGSLLNARTGKLLLEGNWKAGQLCGHGRQLNESGETIAEGLFSAGQMQEGWILSGHQRFQGSFTNGKLCGRGEMSIIGGEKNNDSIDGEFVDGVLTGRALYTLASGEVFEGSFLNGQRHGYGILYNNIGQCLSCGVWQQDKFVKCAPVPRKCILVGKFLSDTRHSQHNKFTHRRDASKLTQSIDDSLD